MLVNKYSLRAIKDIARISNDGILAYNLDTAIIEYCNKSFARILGKPISKIKKEGIKGLTETVKDDEDFYVKSFNELKANLSISNLELRLQSEQEKYISIDAYLITRGNVIIAFVRDITNAKEHQNYIVEFGARKDSILDMVYNNLSGPLNLTNNLLDVIDQAHKDQEYRKINNPAILIRENTQQCIDIISSLLIEEHAVSPTISVERKRFDALAKVNIIVGRYKQFASGQEIKVISPNKQLFVTGDDVKFFQIVNNLISNAVKFTDINGTIKIEVKDKTSSFSISVTDDGIGIPEYLQPHLYKRNTPAGRLGQRGEKSIGMGLYIVNKLVKLMNGSISFQSEENKGSSFIVEFPKS